MPAPQPKEIEVRSRAEEMRVSWTDGHESVYAWSYLRGFCPCADCQGHAAGWRFVPVSKPRLARIEEVGNYALHIVWDDGAAGEHTTGIYTFDTLRELCPCDACKQAAGERHPSRLAPPSP